MKINKVLQINDNSAVSFTGELSQEETDLVVEIGLNYLIRAGAFQEITEALTKATKEDEAAMGYADDSEEHTLQ